MSPEERRVLTIIHRTPTGFSLTHLPHMRISGEVVKGLVDGGLVTLGRVEFGDRQDTVLWVTDAGRAALGDGTPYLQLVT